MTKYKLIEEQPNGYLIDDKRLSIDELTKLRALMPGTPFIAICFPRPDDITNPSYEPSQEHAEFLKNYIADPSRFLDNNQPKAK